LTNPKSGGLGLYRIDGALTYVWWTSAGHLARQWDVIEILAGDLLVRGARDEKCAPLFVVATNIDPNSFSGQIRVNRPQIASRSRRT